MVISFFDFFIGFRFSKILKSQELQYVDSQCLNRTTDYNLGILPSQQQLLRCVPLEYVQSASQEPLAFTSLCILTYYHYYIIFIWYTHNVFTRVETRVPVCPSIVLFFLSFFLSLLTLDYKARHSARQQRHSFSTFYF